MVRGDQAGSNRRVADPQALRICWGGTRIHATSGETLVLNHLYPRARPAPEGGYRNSLHLVRAWFIAPMTDYQTRVIIGGLVNAQPPAEIAELILRPDQMEAWRKDFANGNPTDWSTQAYGSNEFGEQIKEAERAHQLALAHQQYLDMKK